MIMHADRQTDTDTVITIPRTGREGRRRGIPAYLAVAGEISSEVATEEDCVIVARISFDRPELFATQRRPGGVDREAERLCREVLTTVVQQSNLPCRRLAHNIILECGAAARRRLPVHRHPV